ncbi:30S ribosomal protein S20 [Patescibacteria group bacterium]|nr:30S ribosomal protein S20 [Patescibacteria group bacterium]MCL5091715.1 30S ribosomal protein S20 [Patescibacteria group bacterium]
MPNIKSAKKKLRQDQKRTKKNNTHRNMIKRSLHAFKKLLVKDRKKELRRAYALIDKAAKRKVIHKNKAARLKSKIGKLASSSKKG